MGLAFRLVLRDSLALYCHACFTPLMDATAAVKQEIARAQEELARTPAGKGLPHTQYWNGYLHALEAVSQAINKAGGKT